MCCTTSNSHWGEIGTPLFCQPSIQFLYYAHDNDPQEGKRLASRPTLFYLMHCGKALYNNLLWKNWSAQCLPRLSVIGNSFSSMRERFVWLLSIVVLMLLLKLEMSSECHLNRATEREFSRDYSYITQAVSVCNEVVLCCPSRWIDVFSDTAVITFPPPGLGTLPQSTWVEPPEPQYQHCLDLEIIQRGTELREEMNWHMQTQLKWDLPSLHSWFTNVCVQFIIAKCVSRKKISKTSLFLTMRICDAYLKWFVF